MNCSANPISSNGGRSWFISLFEKPDKLLGILTKRLRWKLEYRKKEWNILYDFLKLY